MSTIRTLIAMMLLVAVSSSQVGAQDQAPQAAAAAPLRVLYIENAPRWEYRFVSNLLRRDKAVALDVYLASSDAAAGKERGAGPALLTKLPESRRELLRYDVVILGDLEKGFLEMHSERWPRWLRRFVGDHGGRLIVIAGSRFEPDDWLTELLPVQWSDAAKHLSLENAAAVELTAIGAVRGALRLADDAAQNVALWRGLPGIHSLWRVAGVKAGAEVLATCQAGGDDAPLPLIVRQTVGAGECLWIGTDGTWRWRSQNEAKHHERFWKQVVAVKESK